MFLRATADLLRVITTLGGSSIKCHASAVETDNSVPMIPQDLVRVNTAAITTATTTTILDCTTANRRRRAYLFSAVNDHASAPEVLQFIHSDGTTVSPISSKLITLLAGESVIFAGGQPLHYDANGALYGAVPTQQFASLLMSPFFSTAALTSVKTITSGSCFAVYLGKATKAASSGIMKLRVTTAVATITWAEVAIAKGTLPAGVASNPTLTVVGFLDVSASHNTTGQKAHTIAVSSGQSINVGDDLWAIIGCSATTPTVVRAASIADDIQMGIAASAASRPSTIIGTPTAFTVEGATTLPAWVSLQL